MSTEQCRQLRAKIFVTRQASSEKEKKTTISGLPQNNVHVIKVSLKEERCIWAEIFARKSAFYFSIHIHYLMKLSAIIFFYPIHRSVWILTRVVVGNYIRRSIALV